MPTVVRTTLPTVLLAIQARLMDKLSLPPERCLIIAVDKFPYDGQADQVVAIRPLEESQHNEDEAGRVDHRSFLQMLIYLRTRLALDESNQSLLALTDSSLGHLKFRADIKNALHDFQAADEDKNRILVDPVRWRSSRKPDKEGPQPEWIQSESMFDLSYEDDFDQSDQ